MDEHPYFDKGTVLQKDISVPMQDWDGWERRGAEPPWWVILLAYFAYLRSMRPVRSSAEPEILLWLIIMVCLVLTILALVAAGAPEMVGEVVKHWPVP